MSTQSFESSMTAPTLANRPLRGGFRRTLQSRLASSCLALALLLAAGTTCTQAFAQGGLANTVVQAQVMGDAEDKAIREFVDAQINALKQTPEQTMKARDALLAPLARNNNPSNAFRLRFASTLSAKLTDVLRSGSEMQQVNALVIAGELATSDGLAIIRAGRESKIASVRYQAAAAAKRTVAVLSTITPPTIDPVVFAGMLKDLSTQLTKETDVIVIDETLAALTQALDLEQSRESATKELAAAFAHLTTAAGKKPADAAVGQALLRASDKLRDVATRARGATPDFHKACAQIGATSIAHGARLVKAKALAQDANDETRKLVSQLAGSGETLLLTAGQGMQRTLSQEGVAGKLAKATVAGDVEFAESAKRLLDAAKAAPIAVPATMLSLD